MLQPPLLALLLLPVLATAQLTALVDFSGNLAIATLHENNGTVDSVHPLFGTSGGGLSGNCNAAFDGANYYKALTDGMLHIIDASTGTLSRKVALPGSGPKYGSETFLVSVRAEATRRIDIAMRRRRSMCFRAW